MVAEALKERGGIESWVLGCGAWVEVDEHATWMARSVELIVV